MVSISHLSEVGSAFHFYVKFNIKKLQNLLYPYYNLAYCNMKTGGIIIGLLIEKHSILNLFFYK
jgi:hypothetical protein